MTIKTVLNEGRVPVKVWTDEIEPQAKDIETLKARDEDTKKLLFLMGKVEELINKLNKK